MHYRILGRTGLKVSAIAVGTWQLSGSLNLDGKADGFPDVGFDHAIDLIRSCEDLGINLIDSAEIYGAGEGERRVGEALQGRRDRWIISTKFGFRQGKDGERITDCHPRTIQTSLEGSLQRLKTDYVDIYLYHTPPDPDWIAEGKAVLDALKQAGKIRCYGISTDDPEVLKQLIDQQAVEVVLFSQSLLTTSTEILSLVQAHNLGAMVRGVFENGLLSGKYFHKKVQLSQDDIRQSWFGYVDTSRYAAYEKFIPEGHLMPSLALRYVLDFDTTHTVVMGGKTIAEYQNALRAFELSALDLETRAALAEVGRKVQRRSLQRVILNKLKRAFA